MDPVFHVDLQALLRSGEPVTLDLGAGVKGTKRGLSVDRLDLPGVDIVADLENGLPFMPENSVTTIHARSVLEHIRDLETLMRDVWRVLKPDGRLEVFVPHFSNPYFYSDPTHQRFFGLYSFEYFSKSQTRFRRRVPQYCRDFSFRTEEIELVISSPWRLLNALKRPARIFFNLSPALQEVYECGFFRLVSCYALRATLRPEK